MHGTIGPRPKIVKIICGFANRGLILSENAGQPFTLPGKAAEPADAARHGEPRPSPGSARAEIHDEAGI